MRNYLLNDYYLRNKNQEVFGLSNYDVFTSNGDYFIDLLIPGIEKKDIKIDYNDGKLTIRGERKEKDGVDYLNKNSFFGKIVENYKIPFEPEKIKAELNNGVLRICLKRKKKDIPSIEF